MSWKYELDLERDSDVLLEIDPFVDFDTSDRCRQHGDLADLDILYMPGS